MKKIITTVIVLHAIIVANAQENNGCNEEVFQVSAAIIVTLSVMAFILAFLKSILEHRLKNKIVDKGVPENVVSSILQPGTSEEKHRNIKWFAILAGIGAGLLIVYYTQPLDIHSLAIMALSISVSFLGYHLFTKHVDK
jgi:hypothetical protein